MTAPRACCLVCAVCALVRWRRCTQARAGQPAALRRPLSRPHAFMRRAHPRVQAAVVVQVELGQHAPCSTQTNAQGGSHVEPRPVALLGLSMTAYFKQDEHAGQQDRAPAGTTGVAANPRPHLRRDWAHPAHICAGTGLTPPTSAPGLGSPRPHLRRDRATARTAGVAAHGWCTARNVAWRTEPHTACAASPGADVACTSPVPVQMWHARAQSRRRCGMREPSPGADVAGTSPVPVQMRHA